MVSQTNTETITTKILLCIFFGDYRLGDVQRRMSGKINIEIQSCVEMRDADRTNTKGKQTRTQAGRHFLSLIGAGDDDDEP